jgi:tetratricopeptide (TPR) repeat protein
MKVTKLIIYIFIMLALFLFVNCSNNNIQKGTICLSLGDYQMAITFFEKELFMHPQNYEARLGLGKALLQNAIADNNDSILWKKALIQLEAAQTLQPEADLSPLISDAWFEHSRVLLENNDSIGALAALSQAIEHNNKNVVAINNAGIIYFKKGETGKAESLFKKAITIENNNVAGHFNLGMIYWSKQDFDDARACLITAAHLDPADDDIVYWLALVEKSLQGINQ